MADDDFKITIGLESEAGTKGTQGSEGISFGISKGLKMAGVIGLLSQIKIVTDVIGITLQLIGVGIVAVIGLLGGLLGLFITKIISFFEDPTRSLLSFGLFIVNGIIGGLEFVLNGILGLFGVGAVELPRFQEMLVMEAYDEFRETTTTLAEEGKVMSKEGLDATIKFMKGLRDSFITNTEFQVILQERAKETQSATDAGLDEVSLLANGLGVGAKSSADDLSTAFSEFNNMIRTFKGLSEDSTNKMGGRSTGTTIPTAKDVFDYRKSQTTIATEKEAKTGLYLLSKLGGYYN